MYTSNIVSVRGWVCVIYLFVCLFIPFGSKAWQSSTFQKHAKAINAKGRSKKLSYFAQIIRMSNYRTFIISRSPLKVGYQEKPTGSRGNEWIASNPAVKIMVVYLCVRQCLIDDRGVWISINDETAAISKDSHRPKGEHALSQKNTSLKFRTL